MARSFDGVLYVCFSAGAGILDPYARRALYHEATSWTPSFVICLFVFVFKESVSTTGIEILVWLLAFQSPNLAIFMSMHVFFSGAITGLLNKINGVVIN